jgi:hypothetical protein
MTALQELIKQCNDAKKYIDGVMTDYEAGQRVAYEAVIDMATELLEKERQQIIDAYGEGWIDGANSTPVPEPNGTGYEAETYYNNTFGK